MNDNIQLSLNEDTAKHIVKQIKKIIEPEIIYRDNYLEMANNVILQNKKIAEEINDLFNALWNLEEN